MLALKSRMHAKGFSAMEADELYFINGGSCTMDYNGSKNNSPSTDSKVLAVISGINEIRKDINNMVYSYIQTAADAYTKVPIGSGIQPDPIGPASPCNL